MARRCPYCAEEIQDAAVKCRHCLTWLNPGPDTFRGTDFGHEVGPVKGRSSFGMIRRPRSGRMIAGVCAALGQFLGIDPTWLRIAFAVVTIFTAGLPGVIAYIILAVVIPSEEDPDRWIS